MLETSFVRGHFFVRSQFPRVLSAKLLRTAFRAFGRVGRKEPQLARPFAQAALPKRGLQKQVETGETFSPIMDELPVAPLTLPAALVPPCNIHQRGFFRFLPFQPLSTHLLRGSTTEISADLDDCLPRQYSPAATEWRRRESPWTKHLGVFSFLAATQRPLRVALTCLVAGRENPSIVHAGHVSRFRVAKWLVLFGRRWASMREEFAYAM